MAQVLVLALKETGENLTRKNIVHQAANIKELAIDMKMPGPG
jgi:hypothetical protein